MKKISATEALYGFMGWLTGRDESITLGACHDAAQPAELVRAFLEANNIKEAIPEDWPKRLVYPSK